MPISALGPSAVVCGLLLTVACGGSTKDDDIFTDAEAGEAGAGTSVGGAGNGGGDSSSVGGSTGGSSTAGSSAAGSSGRNGPTPEELAPSCEALCRGSAAAACQNGEREQDCLRQCRLAVNQPACAGAFQSLFECSEGRAFSCNAAGEAVIPECELQFAVAGLCFLGSAPDPALRAPCERYCASSEAAACPNGDPAADCLYGCQSAGALAPDCGELWSAFLTCSESAAFACGEDGKPVPSGCESGFLRYVACILDASG